MILSNFLTDMIVPEDDYPEMANYSVVAEVDGELYTIKAVRWDHTERGVIIEVDES